MLPIAGARRIEDIDWARWVPQQQATLLFVIRNDQVLMIRKKRGVGAGNINGPGGRIEPGESAFDGAIREVQEELCVTAVGVQPVGILQFQSTNGFSIEIHVFTATNCHGKPTETDEAIPIWFDLDKVPYDEMETGDRLWVPFMLARKRFKGRFLFDGDKLIDHQVQEVVSSNE